VSRLKALASRSEKGLSNPQGTRMKDLDQGERPPTAPAKGVAAPPEVWRRIAHGTPLGRAAAPAPQRNGFERTSRRFAVSLPVSFTSIDPLRDPASGQLYYDTSEREELLNVSLRGACLRVERAPEDGTRLLLRVRPPGTSRPVDLIARTRWSRVEYLPGEHAARASAVVGLELIGGSREALDLYECGVQNLHDPASDLLAAPEASG
jgi:hypothetical protein